MDSDLNPVEKDDNVITELWKIQGDKGLKAILGDMQSCEPEEIVIGEEGEVDDTRGNSLAVDTVDSVKISTKKKHELKGE